MNKDILWLKKCIYDTIKNELDIDNVRIRLFKSTADKIFKTFRPIYKNFYRPKSRSKNKNFSNFKVDKDIVKLNNTASINLNYIQSLTDSNDNDQNSNELLKSYHPVLNNQYLNT